MPKIAADPRSPMARQLSGELASKVTPLDAFKLARKKFLAGERVDMGLLADELGVSRVTLYRWAGSRENLLTEIMWSLVSRALEEEGKRTRAKGGERVAIITAHFINGVIAHPGMQAFLDREGEAAMRLVTSTAGEFQKRLIKEIRRLLAEEVERRQYKPSIPLDDLAYAVVRLGESYAYRRFITGKAADARGVEQLLKLLLR